MVFDTGTLCHMIGICEILENVKGIDPVIVGLRDGNLALASKVGTVKLGSKLIPRDVLFVSKLTCNLISIYQLNKESNSIVTFTNSFCVIQDRTLKT